VWIAEGFFHSFSGWLLFVSALMLFVAEMRLLARIGNDGDRRSLSDRLWPRPEQKALLNNASARGESIRPSIVAPSCLFAIGLLATAMIGSTQLAQRAEASLPRQLFVDFPMAVGEWSGRTSVMEKEYVDSLRFDDYLLADYRQVTGGAVNLYVAYYQSQKAGRSAHSPKTCIPGGGWEITSMRSMAIDAPGPGESLTVNRAIIQKGDQKQLVFYWFQQRGRVLANEYLVKFYLLWDALVMNRTDGALVRLMTSIDPEESEAAAEGRLVSFARTARPLLTAYIPE
jgi:EpsI family protein